MISRATLNTKSFLCLFSSLFCASDVCLPAAIGQCPAEWRPFDPTTARTATATSITADVLVIQPLASGEVLIGGSFTRAGVPARRIARWTGSAWSAIGDSVGPFGGNSPSVRAITTTASGEIFAGGDFLAANGFTPSSIARWNGSTWSSLGAGISGNVRALVTLSNGDVIAGGRFTPTSLSSPSTRNIGRWNGFGWSPIGGGVSEDWNGGVNAMVALPNNRLLIAGGFSFAGSVQTRNVALWNGTGWSALGAGTNGLIHDMVVRPNGDVIVAGEFSAAGGMPASNIARWNGSTWSALGSGLNNTAYALTTLANGDVIAGGFFSTAGGVTVNRIARWDGTAWSALGSGVNMAVAALATLPSGDIVAGGFFDNTYATGSNVAPYLMRYFFGAPAPAIVNQPRTQVACPTTSISFAVSLAATSPGPFVYQWQWRPHADADWIDIAAGLNTDPLGGPIRFDAAGQSSPALTVSRSTSSADGPVETWQTRCVVTGTCGSVNSTPANVTMTAGGRADVGAPGQSERPDGSLSADDICVYLNWYFASDLRADFAGPNQSSIPDGELSADDIIVFLNRYFAGC